MLAWIKALFTKVGKVLQPLLRILLSDIGRLMVSAAQVAVAEVAAKKTAGMSWDEALKLGVNKATGILESQGLQMGVDFFLNDLIGAVSSVIAKNYSDKVSS